MQSWIFSSRYFSLQYHMILQKSFWFAAQEPLFLLSVFQLLHNFVETVFYQDLLMNKKFKRTAFIWNKYVFYHV